MKISRRAILLNPSLRFPLLPNQNLNYSSLVALSRTRLKISSIKISFINVESDNAQVWRGAGEEITSRWDRTRRTRGRDTCIRESKSIAITWNSNDKERGGAGEGMDRIVYRARYYNGRVGMFFGAKIKKRKREK